MDFIPLPDGVASHEPVPDLGGVDYDNHGFAGYDTRQGWNIEALCKGDLFVSRPDWHDYAQRTVKLILRHDFLTHDFGGIQAVVGAFLQTWILFGILQEALNRPVFRHEVSHVAKSTDSQQHLKFITLRPLFKEFVNKVEDLRSNPSRASGLFRCLREAASVLSDLDRALSIGPPFMHLTVHQALAALVETIHYYILLFCPLKLRETEEHIIVHNRVARKRLSQRGWCPNLIERIASTFQTTGLYYASIIPAFGVEGTHTACEDLVCVASNIDQNAYRIRHVPEQCLCGELSCDHKKPECPCRHLSVQQSQIRSTLEDEGFPLIEFDQDGIEIVKYRPGMRYVALSHVWADGMGNPVANAMPICQIQSIHRYVTAFSLNQVSKFWIDTLCVPIMEPLRNTAIVRMAKVYSSADSVLVLSADMVQTPEPRHFDELVFRLFCSNWSTRLWTRQEATLAKDLGIQFLDRAIRFSEFVAARNYVLTYLATTDTSRLLVLLPESWLIGLFNLRSRSKAEPLTLQDFWMGLRFRSTSRPLDVVITGSILMGLDVNRILEAPSHMKMEVFWSCQKTLPSSILWVSGPRLKSEGFSWAPSNLLDPHTTFAGPRSGPKAERTSTSLLVDGVEAILLNSFTGLVDDLDIYLFTLSGSRQRYFLGKEKVNHNNVIQSTEMREAQFVLLLPRLPRQEGEDAAIAMLKEPIAKEDSFENTPRPVPVRYHEKVWIFKEDGIFAQQRLATINESHPERTSNLYKHGCLEPPELRLISPKRRWSIL